MIHVIIVVTGKVQGVFFRASAKAEGDKLNLNGFAQNQPDGSVYIEAEGEEDNLNEFIRWCKQGPPRAEVKHVEITSGELKNYRNFEIRR